jgi:putative restriction endonuclease
MARNADWSWDETYMAFVLYQMLAPKDQDGRNGDVKALAAAIGRTPDAVAKKIANIAAHDEQRIALGKKGLTHGSKKDAEIWERYKVEGDALMDKAIDLLDATVKLDPMSGDELSYFAAQLPEGKDRLVIARTRVNQQYFRNTLLENYEHRCCVTGLKVDQLLVASHIKPWSDADPASERLAADNGLLLNAFHDKPFDRGLMTIDDDCRIFISRKVKKDEVTSRWLFDYEGRTIQMPRRCRPRREFIEYHNDVVFQG